MNNSTSPVYQNLDIVGVKNNVDTNGENAVTQSSGHVFIPKTPEVFAYDADGNLTSDGRWTYTWDAENRLMSMESIIGLPAEAKRRLGKGSVPFLLVLAWL